MTRVALLILAGCGFSGPHLGTSGDAPLGDAPLGDAPAHDGGPVPDAPAVTGPVGPGGVPGTIALWLVADDAPHDASNRVTGWPDRGPNHVDLAVDSSRTAPTFNPATAVTAATVKFGNSRLARAAGLWPAGTAINDATLVAVVKDDTSGDFDWLLYTGTMGGDRLSISRSYTTSPMRWDFDVPISNRMSIDQPNGRAMVMTYVASVGAAVSGASHRALFVNGAPVVTAAAFAGYANLGKPLELGDHDDGAGGDAGRNPYDGYLGELYVASSVPASPAQLEQLETYFGLRYGIALAHAYRDGTGAVVWDTGSGYDTRIAGLAIDPAAHLDVRAASSTEGGDLLRISTAATLPAGPHAYLIGGDNNQALAFTAGRLQRVWRFVGGSWGAPVTIDVAGMGGTAMSSLPAAATIMLMYDTSPGFANPTLVPMTLANHRYTATVTLPATAYVTFEAM